MAYRRRHRCALCSELISRGEVVYRYVAKGRRSLAPAHQHCLDRLRLEVGRENVWLRRRRFACWCCNEMIERHEAVSDVYSPADTHYQHPRYAHAQCAYDEAMCR